MVSYIVNLTCVNYYIIVTLTSPHSLPRHRHRHRHPQLTVSLPSVVSVLAIAHMLNRLSICALTITSAQGSTFYDVSVTCATAESNVIRSASSRQNHIETREALKYNKYADVIRKVGAEMQDAWQFQALVMSSHGVLGKHFKFAINELAAEAAHNGITLHDGRTFVSDITRRIAIANAKGNYIIAQSAQRAVVMGKSNTYIPHDEHMNNEDYDDNNQRRKERSVSRKRSLGRRANGRPVGDGRRRSVTVPSSSLSSSSSSNNNNGRGNSSSSSSSNNGNFIAVLDSVIADVAAVAA
jgi:hypothetical protein